MKNHRNGLLQQVKGLRGLSKKKKRLLAVIAAGCLLVLAACYTVFLAPLLEREQWVYKEAVVERGTLKVGVTESGSLEYGITSLLYDLDLDVSAEDEEDEEEDEEEEAVQKYLKIEEIYVTAGQRIQEGDLLVKFTEDSVEDVRRLLESAVVDAQSEYADARSEYDLAALEAETDYEIQLLEAEYADTIYRKGSQSIGNEIAALQAELTLADRKVPSLEETLTEAQEDYAEALADYEAAAADYAKVSPADGVNFTVYQSAYTSALNQYTNAKNTLTRARQSLEDNEAETASLQRRIAAARSGKAVDQLEAEQAWQESVIGGENARITYQAELESLKESLAEEEAARDKVQEQLDAFEAFVGEDGCLYAETGGIVTAVAYEAEDRLREAGTILSYGEPEKMTISVDVTQEDIVDLQVGDKVDITFTAYEDSSYEGSISSINTTATAVGSNTVSYTVVINVEGDTSLLYGGMTADIVFVTEQKEDVLFISRKAIVEEEGKTYVYRRTALGGRELQEVETGISNGTHVEIISGLEEGDIIYLASRVTSQEEVAGTGGESKEEKAGQDGFETPEGVELPEGQAMPEGMEEFPRGNMPDFGGGMPGGGSESTGGGMPGGGMSGGSGESTGGGMPGGGGR